MKNFVFVLCAFFVIGMSSCGVDCEDSTALGAEVGTALSAYTADPSEDNCKELKSKLEESLDYSDCDGATQEGIDNTKALIASLDC